MSTRDQDRIELQEFMVTDAMCDAFRKFCLDAHETALQKRLLSNGENNADGGTLKAERGRE